MEFKAYKMDGLGNDFVIIDQRNQSLKLNKEQIIKICNRNFIGCDQLIFINKIEENNVGLEFYNSDGSISGACGNGTRCVAFLLFNETKNNEIEMQTSSGKVKSKILNNNLVETNIGKPKTNWNEIPINEEFDTKKINIEVLKQKLTGTAVNVGNPHIIFFVENLNHYDLKKIGPSIENHNIFPERCNVTFAKIINEKLIKVNVWERGAGLTKACGTAACATAFAAKINGHIKSNTDIEFELGKLSIKIDDENNIHMNGPVSNIKEITIKI